MEERKECCIPYVNTCCCFFNLRMGVMSIAILCIVGSLNNMIIIVSNYDEITSVIPLLQKMNVTREDQDYVKLVARIMFGVLVAVWIIVSGVLLAGALRLERKLLVPWMTTCAACMLLGLGTLISVATLFFLFLTPVYGALCLVFGILSLGVFCYFLLVVYSFYRELDDDQIDEFEGGSFLNNPPQYFR